MILSEKARKTIRQCNLEWHCHEIKISQEALKDGFEFEGYGIVKSTDNGGLYLDFVCIKSNKRMDFRVPIPEDSLDDNQEITMRATTIDGVKIESKGLRIESDFQQTIHHDPTLYRIGLRYIEFSARGDVLKY